jgi:hypothetical protein
MRGKTTLSSVMTLTVFSAVLGLGFLTPASADGAPAAPAPRGAAVPADALTTSATTGPLLDAPQHGSKAIRQLGDQLDVAAARNDLRPAELRTLLRTDETAWVDTSGAVYYVDPARDSAPGAGATPATAQVAPLPETFALHSNPGASLTILLDFDGANVSGTQWNTQKNVTPGNQPAWDPAHDGPTFSDSEKIAVQQVWAVVAEDYAPFNVDVTTADPGDAGLVRSSSSDTTYGTRVLVTPSADAWLKICSQSCGGVAYTGIFDQASPLYHPAWVFPQGTTDDPKSIAEAASHEAGHTLGLTHDGTSTEGYYTGHGVWAPIMGVGYYKPLVQWSRGSYVDASNHEDDLSVLGRYLGARPDEASDSVGTPTTLPTGPAVIGAPGDVDSYLLGTCASSSVVNLLPAEVAPNLDIRAVLYDATGTQRAVSQPASGLGDGTTASGLGGSLTIPGSGAGWVVTVEGVGEADWASNGYDDYGSLGAYTVSAPGCDGAPAAGTPSAPGNVSGVSPGPGSLTLSWDAPAAPGSGPVTGYLVSRSGSANAETLAADARGYTYSGLAAGTTYLLSVRAVNATGAGPSVTVNVTTPRVAPSVPRNVTGSYLPQTGQLRTLWSEPLLDGGAPITGYRIYLDGVFTGQLPATARGALIGRDPAFPPGQYVMGVAAQNAVGASAIVSTTITVPPPDNAAPVLSEFTFSPTSVNVNANVQDAAKQVTVSARVTDATGTTTPTMVVDSDSTTETAGSGPMTLSSGTPQDGTWSKTLTMPTDAATGSWTVRINALSDTLGNSEGTAHDHGTKLTVSNTPVADTAAPALSSFAFTPTSVNVNDGAKQVTVSARVTDVTGTTAPTMVVDSDSTTETAGPGPMTLSSGTAQDGTWSKTVTIPGTATPGAWTVTINALSDTLGNSEGTAHNHPTKLTVTNTPVARVPDAPTGVTATAGNAQADVSWTAPAANGSPITGYTVFGFPGGFVKTAAAGQTNTTITGLSNGVAYTFTVVASNAIGNSPASAASNAVTPATAPAAPTGVTASAGDALAFVSWTAPAANGSPITAYTLIARVGGVVERTMAVGGGSTSATMTGLTNGTTYVFTVTATNGVGDSPASAASAPVTPAAPVVNPPSGPDPACVAATAHLATVNGVLQQAQRGLATAKKKLKAAKAAPASVRASKVKKAKAKVAAATRKVKAAQGAVSAAQASVTAACR